MNIKERLEEIGVKINDIRNGVLEDCKCNLEDAIMASCCYCKDGVRLYEIKLELDSIIAEVDKVEPVDYTDIKLVATLIVKSCDNFGKFRQENPMAENFDVVEGFVEAIIHSLLSRQRQSLAYLNRSSYTAPQPDNKELLLGECKKLIDEYIQIIDFESFNPVREYDEIQSLSNRISKELGE